MHLSRFEAEEMVQRGTAEWIKQPTNRKEKGIVRRLKKNFAVRGLSAKVGATLVHSLNEHHPWAGVMLADIRRNVQPPA